MVQALWQTEMPLLAHQSVAMRMILSKAMLINLRYRGHLVVVLMLMLMVVLLTELQAKPIRQQLMEPQEQGTKPDRLTLVLNTA